MGKEGSHPLLELPMSCCPVLSLLGLQTLPNVRGFTGWGGHAVNSLLRKATPKTSLTPQGQRAAWKGGSGSVKCNTRLPQIHFRPTTPSSINIFPERARCFLQPRQPSSAPALQLIVLPAPPRSPGRTLCQA